MGASALQHDGSSPACECFCLFRRAKSSQDKSSQVVKSSRVKSVVGHSVPPCPVFRSSHPPRNPTKVPSSCHISHLTSLSLVYM
jgi:hypothetical protein